MKKTFTKISAVIILAASAVGLAGCNKFVFDTNFKLNYAVIEENGQSVLHEIEQWSDSESDSVVFSCKKCGNYIWSSSNQTTVYRDKPKSYAYDTECCQ